MLIEKVRQRNFLYDTKSRDYRDQNMRANEWEGIRKELKIKRKFYVSSRDVRIVCPRLKAGICTMSEWRGRVTRDSGRFLLRLSRPISERSTDHRYCCCRFNYDLLLTCMPNFVKISTCANFGNERNNRQHADRTKLFPLRKEANYVPNRPIILILGAKGKGQPVTCYRRRKEERRVIA